MKKTLITLSILTLPLLADDTFNLELSKTNAFLNEPILATFTLSYPKDKKPRFIKFSEVRAKGFLIKKIDEKKSTTNNLEQIKYRYALFAQVAKELKFNYQTVKIARLEPKTSMVIWKSLDTNEQTINILPIPKDTTISGDLELNVKSKQRDESIFDLTITLKGIANFNDIEPFKLDLKDATIYNTKPKVSYYIKDGKLEGNFTQKITILSKSRVKIKPITFSYFNTNTKMLEFLKSKELILTPKSATFSYKNLLWLIIGAIFGSILTILAIFIKKQNPLKKLPLEQQISLCKTQKCLYKTLLPYINRYDLYDIIKRLEENIFKNRNYKIDKKEIIKRVR